MSIRPELLARLEDFQSWKDGQEDFELLDYVQCVATPDLFFAFQALLVPDLVLHDGHYFLASHFELALYAQWKEKLGDPIGVQKVMNHLHISSLFQEQKVSPEVAVAAATLLAETWSRVFADKGLVGTAYGSSLEDAEVTLSQAPTPSHPPHEDDGATHSFPWRAACGTSAWAPISPSAEMSPSPPGQQPSLE